MSYSQYLAYWSRRYLIRKFIFNYMLLISSVNTHRLFLWKKEGIIITSAFQKLLKDSNDKPNKIWLDKSSQFYNRSMKSFLQNNNIQMYSTHDKGKSIVAERYIRTLKNKIYKSTTSVLYVDIDKWMLIN